MYCFPVKHDMCWPAYVPLSRPIRLRLHYLSPLYCIAMCTQKMQLCLVFLDHHRDCISL